MIGKIEIENKTFEFDFSKAIDLSIPISDKGGASAWYVDPPKISPVKTEHFNGSVKDGGDVNFRNIFFNPHGNGTHTETVGHISEEIYSVNENMKEYFFIAKLISVEPEEVENNGEIDRVITRNQIEKLTDGEKSKALIIRTIPNKKNKLTLNYSDTNPAYFEGSAMQLIYDLGVQHLLVDLPSLDREKDGGKLANHRIFWNFPQEINLQKTITEFIFVDNEIQDGVYLLNMQVAPFENDASPSRPILFELKEIE